MRNFLRSFTARVVYFFGFAVFSMNIDLAARTQGQAFAMEREGGAEHGNQSEIDPQLGPSRIFKELGATFDTPSWAEKRQTLVWSGVAPAWMTQPEAHQFCINRGGRLPSREDFWALMRYLGISDPEHEHSSDGGLFLASYKSHLMPTVGDNWYWSSSELSESREFAYTFYSPGGSIGLADLRRRLAVRCVYDLWQKTKRRHLEPELIP